MWLRQLPTASPASEYRLQAAAPVIMSLATAPPYIQLLVFLFPGFEPLDADGPICILGCLPEVEVITIADLPGPVTSSTGRLTWVASHGLAEGLQLQRRHKELRQCPAAGRRGSGAAEEGQQPPPPCCWLLV